MTNNQLQVILTGIVGDGCLVKPIPKRTKYYSYITNCIHKEYIEYKANLLGDMASTITGRMNMGYKKSIIYKMHTKGIPEIANIAKSSLKKNLNRLNDLGIALWFYDDGSFHKVQHSYNLCTHAFSKEEHTKIIIPFLEKRLKIKVKLRYERKKDGRLFWYCAINKFDGAKIISELLQKYPVECYRYKMGIGCTFSDKRKERFKKKV